ncbi:MAG: hypothetical protein K2X82_31845 [Gemmataceae bacterium]|nr:hypothetical protein [Gemmataceae bacterium]
MRGSPARRSVLGCESLEGRDCPAGSITVFRGILTVNGDDGANVVTVSDDGAGGITATVDGTSKTATDIRVVRIATGAGDDSITYTLTGDVSKRQTVEVRAGTGADTVTLAADGKTANARFDFVATGGAGNDKLTSTFGSVGSKGRVEIGLTGGADNDTIGATVGAVAGQYRLAAFGLDGTDALSAAVGGVAARGVADIGLAGGGGDDTVTATASGEYDGRLLLGLFGDGVNPFAREGGKDTVTAAVTVAAGSTGRVAAGVAGGAGDDTVGLSLTGDGLDGLKSKAAVIDGGRGTDTATPETTANVKKVRVEK